MWQGSEEIVLPWLKKWRLVVESSKLHQDTHIYLFSFVVYFGGINTYKYQNAILSSCRVVSPSSDPSHDSLQPSFLLFPSYILAVSPRFSFPFHRATHFYRPNTFRHTRYVSSSSVQFRLANRQPLESGAVQRTDFTNHKRYTNSLYLLLASAAPATLLPNLWSSS